jgi:hypothetical protein
MQAVEVEVVLAELAAGQWGLFTAQQARQVGVSRVRLSRLTQAGALLRLAHGVYALRGAAGGRHLELRAAWLGVEPSHAASDRLTDGASGVVVSHASAADLYGFGDLDADRHEFTASMRKQTRRPDVRFHRAFLSATEITLRDGLPVTTPGRLIMDLLADGHDGGHVAGVLADAVRARAIVVADLPERLAPFAARFGHDAGDGQGLVDELLDLGGVLDLVVADQLSDIARADNKSLAELVSTAVGSQALAAIPTFMNTAAFTNAFTSGSANEALANLARSPALAAALQDSTGALALARIAQSPAFRDIVNNSNLTNAIAATMQSPAIAEAARASSAAAAINQMLQSSAVADAIKASASSEAISKMMQSPAIAEAIRNSRASETLITNLTHATQLAHTAATGTKKLATSRGRRALPADANDATEANGPAAESTAGQS